MADELDTPKPPKRVAPPKRAPTEAQVRRAEEFAAQSQKSPEQMEEGTETAGLAIVLGEGEDIHIGGERYHLGPYQFKNLRKGFEYVRECVAILVSAALAGVDGQAIDPGRLAMVYNRMTGVGVGTDRPDDGVDGIRAVQMLTSVPEMLSEEKIMDLCRPLHLGLSRHHPDITIEMLYEEMDIPMFVSSMRALYRVNTGLLSTF